MRSLAQHLADDKLSINAGKDDAADDDRDIVVRGRKLYSNNNLVSLEDVLKVLTCVFKSLGLCQL